MKHVLPHLRGAARRAGGLHLRLVALCAAAAFCAPAVARDLRFEEAFATKGEPAAIHYQAVFVSHDSEHRLEVWRDGDRRIKRRTDDALEVYALHKSDTSEFRLSVLDLKKKIHSEIDRSNLYRIGNFSDWFDLGHGLRHPAGTYRVVAANAPDSAVKPIAPCKWLVLEQNAQVTHICWSAKSRLPLLMANRDGRIVWRVTALDHKPVSARVFDIHDEGFIRNNANEDIEND